MGQPFGCLTTRRYDPRVGTFHCTSVYVHSPAAAVIDRAKGKPPDRYGSSATFRAKEATSAFAPIPDVLLSRNHLEEVRTRKLTLIAKTEAAVKDRLTKEISYWDHRAEQLKAREAAGKPNARLNSGEARKANCTPDLKSAWRT